MSNPFEYFTQYELRHLAAHLEEAGRSADLHRLLATETSEQRNAWYDAHYQRGEIRPYLDDLNRAWRIADVTQNLALQCRYALIRSSITSFADKISPRLLIAVVEKMIWTPSQAQTYALQVSEETQRTKLLVNMIPHLPKELLHTVLEATIKVSEENQTKLFTALAPYLPESALLSALTMAQQMSNIRQRAETLAALAPRLKESWRYRALRDTLEEILVEKSQFYGDGWVESLATMAPYLSKELMLEALPRLQQLSGSGDSFREWHLGKIALRYVEVSCPGEALTLARHFRAEEHKVASLVESLAKMGYIREAVIVSEEIAWLRGQTRALSVLAQYLPAEAIRIALQIRDEKLRAEAFRVLLPHFPEAQPKQVQEVVANVCQISDRLTRIEILRALVPYLSTEDQKEALQEAVESAREISNADDGRIDALAVNISHLPIEHQREVLHEALITAQQISITTVQKRALDALYPYLEQYVARLQILIPHLTGLEQQQVLHEALLSARQIGDPERSVRVFKTLLPHLTEAEQQQLLSEALAAARQIGDPERRVRVLLTLLPHLTEAEQQQLLSEALVSTRQIGERQKRVRVLQTFLPYLPEGEQQQILHEALTTAREIEHLRTRASAIKVLTPDLPPSLKEEILWEELAAAEKSHLLGLEELTELLFAFVPSLSEDARRKAVVTARKIVGDENRAKVLDGLIPHLTNDLLREMLVTEQRIDDVTTQVEALQDLAPYLPEEMLHEVLAIIERSKGDEGRIRALQKLAPYLTELLLQEALTSAYSLSNKDVRRRELQVLIPYLPSSVKARVSYELLSEVNEIEGNVERGLKLAELVPLLPKPLPAEVQQTLLQAVLRGVSTAVEQFNQQEEDLNRRISQLGSFVYHDTLYDRQGKTLTKMASCLAQLGAHQKSLVIIREIKGIDEQVKGVSRLVQDLPTEQLQEAVEIAQRIHYNRLPTVLSALAPYLPEPLLQETLKTAQQISDKWERGCAIAQLAPYLPELLLREALTTAQELATESTSAQEKALEGVAPRMAELGFAEEALASIQPLKAGYGKAQIIIKLIPWLPPILCEAILPEALALRQHITQHSDKSYFLKRLAPHMDSKHLREALAVIEKLSPRYKRARADALHDLAPYLPEECIEEIFQETIVVARQIEQTGAREEIGFVK